MNLEDGNILIFKNKSRKQDNHPSHVGYACVDGKQREIALWPKESENAGRFLSGKINFPKDKPSSNNEEKPSEFDDDIPF